jgi:leucyl aminopeptidase
MEILIEVNGAPAQGVPLGVFTFSDRLEELPEGVAEGSCASIIYRRMVEYGEIEGKAGEAPYCITCEDRGANRIFFIGLGSRAEPRMEDYRRAGASFIRRLRRFNVPRIDLRLPHFEDYPETKQKRSFQAFTEGFILRNYDFTRYTSEVKERPVQTVRFIEPDDSRLEMLLEGLHLGKLFGNATNFCRDLGNEPANVMTPQRLAELALEIGRESERVTVEVLDEKDIERLGMGLFAAIAQSASTPPRLIVMYYDSGHECAQTIGLVGKGVTFDSGGISIKRAEGMFHMKRDLGGGAAVIAAIRAISQMDLKVNVAAVVGATENMVGSRAYKPGDIIRSMSGKTVEVLNTDAEGRLLLADLLTFLQERWDPEVIIDIATLTGNIQRALGSDISGLMTNSDELYEELQLAAERSNDKIWRMPLEESYRDAVESHFADLKNISSNAPDAIFAAFFLERFIDEGRRWAHLDIAGTDTHLGKASTYHVRGATGVGTRLLLEFILERGESPDALSHCEDEEQDEDEQEDPADSNAGSASESEE